MCDARAQCEGQLDSRLKERLRDVGSVAQINCFVFHLFFPSGYGWLPNRGGKITRAKKVSRMRASAWCLRYRWTMEDKRRALIGWSFLYV